MSVATRLLGFAALLAAVFALAAVAGNAADLGKSEPPADAGHGEARHGGSEPVADPVRGLGVSADGLTLDPEGTTAAPGRRFELRFAIRDRQGRVVRDFDVEHTRRMHVIVARRDMTGFQHLHPTQRPDGTWAVPVRLSDPGAYRVFADFSRDGAPRTLGGDLTVDGPVNSRPLPAAGRTARTGGFDVALKPGAGALGFEVTRGGEPVAVEPYLGAKGHLVALREGDLAYLHVHPDADRLQFEVAFPTAGRYRLFLQFKVAGRMHTAAFTREVGR